MPLASPRYMFSGSLRGLGTESKAITGGVCCCAKTGEQSSSNRPDSKPRINSSLGMSRYDRDRSVSPLQPRAQDATGGTRSASGGDLQLISDSRRSLALLYFVG